MQNEEGTRVVVFGSLNVDLVCQVMTIAHPGETVLTESYDQLFGGKGANQAVSAARALGVAGRVTMVGTVGADALGDGIIANLEAEGVDVAGLKRNSGRTGCAFISLDRFGQNAITVASGTNADLASADLDDRLLRRGVVLVLQMETPIREVIAAARKGHRKGAIVVVNLAPVPADLGVDDLTALCEACDYLIVNEGELSAAAALCAIAPTEFTSQASALADRFGLIVIATLGGDGALVADRLHVEAFAAPRIVPVDTTGAGDTFVGIFAASLAGGHSTAESVRRSVAGASLACLKLGAQTAMPRSAEIERAMGRQSPHADLIA